MNHVMLDIETLGLEPGSAIVTLGAVLFDITRQEDPEHDVRSLPTNRIFYRRITHRSNNLLGLSTDPDTLDWWSKQAAPAQFEAFNSKDRQEILRVFIDFNVWYTNIKATHIWSHGSTFDIILVEEVYRRLGLKPPWMYKHHRDTRTILDLANIVEYGEASHHALQDAYEQACTVQKAYHVLKASANKDFMFLQEIKARLKAYNERRDKSELEYVQQMVNDWIDELNLN